MKVAFFKLPGQVEVREVRKPVPQRGQVLVRILASGICGSDDYAYRTNKGIEGIQATDWHQRGHEYAGRVEEVGEGVDHLKPDELVSGIGSLPCGKCSFCRQGTPEYCSKPLWFGGNGFSEYICIEEKWFLPIPNLTAQEGTLMEPLTVAMDLVKDGGVRLGSKVLIIGAGPIGLMTLKLCKISGVDKVYVSHPSHSLARSEVAGDFGADTIFCPDQEDIVKKVREKEPEGVNTVLVTIRPSIGIPQAEAVCAMGGRIALIGMANEPTDTITLNIDRFHFKKLSLIGSNHNPCSRLYPEAAILLEKKLIQADKLISHRFPLGKAKEAFHFVATERGKAIKVIMDGSV